MEGVADDFSSSAFDSVNTYLSQIMHQQVVKNPGADASGPKGLIMGRDKPQLGIRCEIPKNGELA